jgi:subtilisin family serine protease
LTATKLAKYNPTEMIRWHSALACTIFLICASGAAPSDGAVENFEPLQGYLDPPPRGMDVRYAWMLEGGRGENVRLVDIELNWNLNHIDLRAAASNLFLNIQGSDPDPAANIDHGTAVLGILAATDDGIGITGIANRARFGLISPQIGSSFRLAEAIAEAASRLEPGDVILIEQQVIGPRFDVNTGRGLVPPEFDPEVFDAIRAATLRGITVVEPAANGSDDLDHPAYRGAFDRSQRDSGAIIVGASLGEDRSRAEESNYGSRVDLHGWGRDVTTCGYGDLNRGRDTSYTSRFGATSAAAAMVAGAAALLQSIVKARGRPPLMPLQLRQLLVATGTPQSGDLSKNIGPRPNLRAAIEALDAHKLLIPKITSVRYKEFGGKLIVNGENFLPGDSIIEINGLPAPRTRYPDEYFLSDGTTTRLVAKGDLAALMPRGATVSITVLTPSSGRRSEPFPFRREF